MSRRAGVLFRGRFRYEPAFLSPPVALAAFYVKGVALPHVSLNQIFVGMIRVMLTHVLAIGLWLPRVLYS
jgi:TRAP-type mannitol/chloroaromatic compound transport system permease large subunit